MPRSLVFAQIKLRRAWIAAVIVPLAFAGCGENLLPVPADGPPDQMRVVFGAGEGGNRSMEVRGDTVVLRATRLDGTPGDSLRTVPTAQAWRAFWSAARQAGVGRWNARYVDPDVVDGTVWRLRIVHDGALLESDGHDAYPDRLGRSHPEMTDDFRVFLDAVGELAGWPLISE